MVFESYEMITPQKDSMIEYEQFYYSYGRLIKMNLLVNQMLKEIKEKIPIYFLEIMENIENKENKIDTNLLAMGLQVKKGDRRQYKKSIGNNDAIFIRNYFNSDLIKYIDFYTNQQLIIGLYTLFESSIKSYLIRKNNSQIKFQQDDLLKHIFSIIGSSVFLDKFEKIHAMSIPENIFNKIWEYYTNIRNLYSHTGGIISKRFKDDMNGCSSDLRKYTKENLLLECSLFNILNNDFFQLLNIKIGELFCINEYNYRFFNHFLVHIWEIIYLLEIQPNTIITNDYSAIVNNTYKFKIYDTQEDHLLMQGMPETLTMYLDNFLINGYKCPNCNHQSTFLYAKTPGKDVDISLIIKNEPNEKYKVRKIFTCPNCKSFYFPSYEKLLSENNGFNILELNDSDYLIFLKKFNKI